MFTNVLGVFGVRVPFTVVLSLLSSLSPVVPVGLFEASVKPFPPYEVSYPMKATFISHPTL